MKGGAAWACLLLLTACHPTRPCAAGTLFVDLTANGAAMATQLQVTLAVGGANLHSTVGYDGRARGSLVLDFPSGYPAGQQFTLTIVAEQGITPLARGTITGTLPAGCDHLALTLFSLIGDGGATPVLVGSSVIQPTSTASLSPALPATTQAGDYLVLCVYANSSTLTATLPGGWTPLAELQSNQGFHVWWLSRFADGTSAAPTTTLSGQAMIASAALVAVRGVDPKNPVDAADSPTTLTGTFANQQITFVGPAITTTRVSDELVSFFVYDSGDGGSWVTSPTGLTKALDTGSLAVFDGFAAPGTNGPFSATQTFTPNSGSVGTALTLALAPTP